MYSKTAIAMAVAAFAAPYTANAADFQLNESTTFSVYGSVEPQIINETDATGNSSTEFTDNDSTFGLKGRYMFDDATTGYFHAEFEWNVDEAGDGIDSTDEAYFGLKGGFGNIRFGTNDTLYENAVGEVLDKFENVSPTESANNEEGNQITYFSPDFGGFSFGAEARFLGEGEEENPTGSNQTGLELIVNYDAENWGLVAGYSDGSTRPTDTGFVDEPTLGGGGYIELGNVLVRGVYATQDEADGSSTDLLGALVGFDYGSGDIYFAVQDVSPDNADSRTEIAAGIYHKLYKNLEVFIEAGRFDNVNDEGDIVAGGAIFKF